MGGSTLMDEKEYIVTLKKGVEYDQFNQEMIASTGAGNIPNRTVDVANPRLASQRNTHYALTKEEAIALRNDSRVIDVEIPPQDRDDIEIGLTARQSGDFTKTTSDSGNYLNWGMRRCIDSTNSAYGTNTTVSGDYTYHLDGTGVDVVIQDSGLQVDHPEFNDADGYTRVQQINWYTESGVTGTQSGNHYRDYDGHGTHVAGTAAGLTYGWAKNAKVYSLKVGGIEGSGDSGTGISISDCFDVIKEWHNSKSVDPATGYKRPTIVNMSWGYGSYFTSIVSGVYRGTAWTSTSRDTSKGMVGSYTWAGYRYVTRIASVDTDVEELTDAGVHVCIAAGNSYQKIDISAGTDYNNYFTKSDSSTNYYNRGGSPFGDDANIVGNIDSNTHSGGLEQKASSSENGPGVSVWAPGSNIMSSFSNTNAHSDGTYPGNSNYKIGNITGTSMASPQVCGVGALMLQANPHATPAQLKAYIIAQTGSNQIYSTGNDNDYSNSRSINGSNNRFLYNSFSNEFGVRISNS
jgi:subtilisin family serine protease